MAEYAKPPTDPDLIKFMEQTDYDSLTKYMVGNQRRWRDNIIIPRILGPVVIKTNEEKMIEAAVESCPFRSLTSCVVGKFIVHLVQSTLQSSMNYTQFIEDYNNH